MLFKLHQLRGIKSGTITLAFRKWEKPGVKPGSSMRTALGVVGVDHVEIVAPKDLTNKDAVKAGFENLDGLLEALNKVEQGKIYKVKLKYLSADPRIQLREKASLSNDDFEKVKKKLDRLDKLSKTGPWTKDYLKLIRKYPERRAGDLADMMKVERLDFKLNVRKLKNLGMTISHEVGYSISPLGEWVMKKVL